MYYQSKQEKQLAGRSIFLLAGATLGGTSSINMSMYTRAQSCDYNSWGMKG